MRWPIPKAAREKVVKRYGNGEKQLSEFRLRGKLVGRIWWDEGESLGIVTPLRNGVVHGSQLEHHWGRLTFVEPKVNGLQHGWTQQFDSRGRLLIECPYLHGTGTDYYCNDRGQLSEEHPLVDGKLHGFDRWWNEDQRSVYEETHCVRGERHGIRREWWPKLKRTYFVRDAQVTKREYLAAAKRDPTLPPLRVEDDSPARKLPVRFRELRSATRRASAARAPNQRGR